MRLGGVAMRRAVAAGVVAVVIGAASLAMAVPASAHCHNHGDTHSHSRSHHGTSRASASRHEWHHSATRHQHHAATLVVHRIRHQDDGARLSMLLQWMQRLFAAAHHPPPDVRAHTSLPSPGSGPRTTQQRRPGSARHAASTPTSGHAATTGGFIAVVADPYPPRPAPPTLHPGVPPAPGNGSPVPPGPPGPANGSPTSSGSSSSGSSSSSGPSSSTGPTPSRSVSPPRPGVAQPVGNPLHSNSALILLGVIALLTLAGMAYVFWSGRRPDRA